MAKVTNAVTTYNSTTNREELADTIYDISPSDTPFMTLAGRRNVDNRTFEWSTEALPAVNSSNADQEGFVLSNASTSLPSRQTNVTQISHKDATISRSQQASDLAGVGKNKLMANRMARAAKALKRDMETILSGAQARVDGDDTSPTARKTRGFEHFLTTNVSSGTSYAAPGSATGSMTDGTIRTFSKVLLEDLLESAYSNGAEPSVLLCGPYTKRRISTFTGRDGLQSMVDKNSLLTTFSVYETDFGKLKIVPSRWSRARTALLIDPDYVKVAYFRNFETYDIAVTGSANTKVIEVEYGLEVSHEGAHGKIADIPGTKGVDPSPLT